MRDILKDMVRVIRAADIGTVKITGDNGEVTFQGVDDQRTVIMKGNVTNSAPEFDGVSGIGNLDRLGAVLNQFQDANDTVTVARKMRAVRVEKKDETGQPVLDTAGNPEFEETTENAIERFVFNRPKPKMEVNFRVIARNMIPPQYSAKSVDYAVEFTPSAASVDALDKLVSISNGDTFTVKIQPGSDGTDSLFVNLGEVGNESSLEFHPNVQGVLKNTWNWNISQVLKLLKLGNNSTLTLGFSDRGMLRVVVDTGMAHYEFTIPPRQA